MSSALFFAPTYFSPFYYAPLAPTTAGGVTVTPGPTGYRDRDAFAAIIAALAATGEFADVVLGGSLGQNAVGAARTPLAAIAPEQWTENDEVDPCLLVRHVTFQITLLVRDEDPSQRIRQLDRLSSVVQNALDGSDLNGGCLPALTKLRQGNYDRSSSHPEQRVVLNGEFTYLVPSYSGHDTSD